MHVLDDRDAHTPPTEEPSPHRWPRWQVPAGVARWAGVLVPAALLGAAAIHGAWALGWRWPGGSDQAFADRVVGPDVSLPSAEMTWAVAALLTTAAVAVRVTATSPNRLARLMTTGTAAVLLLRGAGGIVTDFTAGLDDVYEQLDLAIYSPFCLAVGTGALAVTQSARQRAPR